VTGVSFAFWEITGKWFELQKQIVPSVTRVAVLVNLLHPRVGDYLRETHSAAHALRVEVKFFEVRCACGSSGAAACGLGGLTASERGAGRGREGAEGVDVDSALSTLRTFDRSLGRV
jgi:hypothetical protein